MLYALIIYILLTIGITLTLNKVFKVEEQKIYTLSAFIGIVFGLGGTFFTSIKSLLNVILYEKDIIFENKLFGIQYVYDKAELKNFINMFYIRFHVKHGPIREKIQEEIILKLKTNTITELKEIILKLVEHENMKNQAF